MFVINKLYYYNFAKNYYDYYINLYLFKNNIVKISSFNMLYYENSIVIFTYILL